MHTLERNSIVACGSSWRLILALASLLALMVPAVAVTDAFAGHAIAPESQVDWRTHLTKVDDAVGESDVPVAGRRRGGAPPPPPRRPPPGGAGAGGGRLPPPGGGRRGAKGGGGGGGAR